MEPWRVFRKLVADSHHFDEEQDPDSDPDPHGIYCWTRIQISIQVMRIGSATLVARLRIEQESYPAAGRHA
jgi:hypothetical protein